MNIVVGEEYILDLKTSRGNVAIDMKHHNKIVRVTHQQFDIGWYDIQVEPNLNLGVHRDMLKPCIEKKLEQFLEIL